MAEQEDNGGMQIDCVVDAKARLGEGPVWCIEEQSLYWVDINGPALHRYTPATGVDRQWAMPEQVGCVALGPRRAQGGPRVVVALASGLAWFDPQTEALEPFLPIEGDNPATRLNDGRCDRQGRMWVGSMGRSGPEKQGTLYRCGPDGSLFPAISPIKTPNALSFSPDGRTMYFTDTPTRRIRAFDYDTVTGEIDGERLFATIPDDQGSPDGACIDAEGCLWVAHFNGWCVTRHRPDGSVDRTVQLPVQRPTCCAFGGPDLDTVYVTSAIGDLDAEALRKHPYSGGVLAFRPGVRGLPESRFGVSDPPR